MFTTERRRRTPGARRGRLRLDRGTARNDDGRWCYCP